MDKLFYTQTIEVPAQCRSKRLREAGIDQATQKRFRENISAPHDTYTGGTPGNSTADGQTPDTAVIVDRGEWVSPVAGQEYLYREYNSKNRRYETHDVYRWGCRWGCRQTGTTEAPGLGCSHWEFKSGAITYRVNRIPSEISIYQGKAPNGSQPLNLRLFMSVGTQEEIEIEDIFDTEERVSEYRINLVILQEQGLISNQIAILRYGELLSDGSRHFHTLQELQDILKPLFDNGKKPQVRINVMRNGEKVLTDYIPVRMVSVVGVNKDYASSEDVRLDQEYAWSDSVTTNMGLDPILIERTTTTYDDGSTVTEKRVISNLTNVYDEIKTLCEREGIDAKYLKDYLDSNEYLQAIDIADMATKTWVSAGFSPIEHSHSYLPLSGGTVNGIIANSLNNGGSWWSSPAVRGKFIATNGDASGWSPVLGFKTNTGKCEIGAFGDDIYINYYLDTRTDNYVDFRLTIPKAWGTLATEQYVTSRGYITSGGSCAYATSAGTAQSLDIVDGVSDFNVILNKNGIYNWGGGGNTPNLPPCGYGTMLQWSNVKNPIVGTAAHRITQLASGTDYRLYFRSQYGANSFSNWQTLAFLTDNVASASKLATARSIWGQNFNGEGDVSGNMSNVGAIYMSGYLYHDGNTVLDYNSNGALILNYGKAINKNLPCAIWGNVGIGITVPSYKLHVVGVTHSTTGVTSDGYITAKTSSSDIRLKTDIRDLGLTLDNIAQAPCVRFRWKADGMPGIGTIAQYWQSILPEAVYTKPGTNDSLCVDYAVLGTAIGLTVGRKLNDLMREYLPKVDAHEDRIRTLEQRIDTLEAENRSIRALLKVS